MDTQFEKQQGWPERPVLGVDEAGRGPWAGPVVAAAALLPARYADGVLAELNDSKKLSAKKREVLFEALQDVSHGVYYGIGMASVEEIDRVNILQATFLAMHRAVNCAVNCAVEACQIQPAFVLVDGNRLPNWAYASQAVIKGDSLSPSIAAASILAKVTRDRLMQKLDEQFSGYGWGSNMGYGTKAHREGLEKLGVSPHHRTSYAPIKKLLTQDVDS